MRQPETRVRKLLNEPGLDYVAGLRIGSEPSRGISGGEKRRVSIGMDLVQLYKILRTRGIGMDLVQEEF